MDDPRGGMLSESTHQVKTIGKARKWYVDCYEHQLPITINQNISSDGRIFLRVYDKYKNLLYSKG
jgi:hypothetical protein